MKKTLLAICALLMTALAVNAAEYYLIGSMTGWTRLVDAKYKFVLNEKAEAGVTEYMLTIDLEANAAFKVISDTDEWFPSGGEENNYVVTTDGKYDIYFRPNNDGDGAWHHSCIYVAPSTPSALGEVAAEAKAVKVIENGQMFIERNGIRFNITGAAVK